MSGELGALSKIVISVVGYNICYGYGTSQTWASRARGPWGQSSRLDTCQASSTLFRDPFLLYDYKVPGTSLVTLCKALGLGPGIDS